MIAALYVETGGAYFGLDDVDPWDAQRDARNYYGLPFRKPTWLYIHGVESPPAMLWGSSGRGGISVANFYGGGRQHLRASTPESFRAALLSIAQSAIPSFDILPRFS